ncbi:hypothetical protein XB05_18965 [Xanthomonas arboricola]|nr:hypothetical protein XB05_18965 [Xanthomonas arboricola]
MIADVIESGRVIKQIAGDKRDHLRISAHVVAQIYDQGICVRHKSHRRSCGLCCEIRIGKDSELHIADVARQPLHLIECEVVARHRRSPLVKFSPRRAGNRLITRAIRSVTNPKMLVLANFTQILGESISKCLTLS